MIMMKRTPFNRLANICQAGFLIFLSGCGAQQNQNGPMATPVTVERVDVQIWKPSYTTTGTIEANQYVDLNTESPGTIMGLYFQEGQQVAKGKTLVRLKADKQLAQVHSSSAELESSRDLVTIQDAEIERLRSFVDAAESRKKLAEAEFQRFQSLFKSKVISSLELDQKRSMYETALADYHAALQQLKAVEVRKQQAIAELRRAKSNYQYTRAVANELSILAPFNGTIGQKYVAVGDYIIPTEKILTLVDNSVLKIAFTVPERYLSSLKIGKEVLVAAENVPGKVFRGSIQFVDPVIDLSSRTVMVKALITDAGNHLRHGQYAGVKLVLNTISNAIVIPEEAVFMQGEKPFVYVVRSQKNEEGKPKLLARLQAIQTGQRDAGRVHVLSGLTRQDQVITSGLQKIFDGAEVMLLEPTESQTPNSNLEAPPKEKPDSARINTPKEKASE